MANEGEVLLHYLTRSRVNKHTHLGRREEVMWPLPPGKEGGGNVAFATWEGGRR